MQRLTARFLLLFALAATFVPVALQTTAAPLHTCCLRKAAHRCHAAGAPQDPVVSNAGCCNHDCCRAVTTAQWGHPETSQAASAAEVFPNREIALSSGDPAREFISSHSSRAPPQSPSL